MRSIFRLTFVCLATLAFNLTTSAQAAKPPMADLGWLGGCWEMSVPDKQLLITEQWMKPAGGMMIGAGRTVKAGKVVDYEFLRIVEETDGVYYVAKPTANKDETRFKLLRSTVSEVVFENPDHDFPQRVIYKLSGTRLNARIEGTTNGKTRGIDFPYTRIGC
ncbi:MAG TPA: DUF6265 family protein [Pyrinomonadaceae bacterium]